MVITVKPGIRKEFAPYFRLVMTVGVFALLCSMGYEPFLGSSVHLLVSFPVVAAVAGHLESPPLLLKWGLICDVSGIVQNGFMQRFETVISEILDKC